MSLSAAIGLRSRRSLGPREHGGSFLETRVVEPELLVAVRRARAAGLDQQFADQKPRRKRGGHEDHEGKEREEDHAGHSERLLRRRRGRARRGAGPGTATLTAPPRGGRRGGRASPSRARASQARAPAVLQRRGPRQPRRPKHIGAPGRRARTRAAHEGSMIALRRRSAHPGELFEHCGNVFVFEQGGTTALSSSGSARRTTPPPPVCARRPTARPPRATRACRGAVPRRHPRSHARGMPPPPPAPRRPHFLLGQELGPFGLAEHDDCVGACDGELLARDCLARLAEHLRVLEPHVCQVNDRRVEDVRRVEPAAEAGLDRSASTPCAANSASAAAVSASNCVA